MCSSDLTAFVERAFGDRRMFADSPLLRALGLNMRIGDPALPLIKRDAQIDEPARTLLQIEKIGDLPDAVASPESPNIQLWVHRGMMLGALATLVFVIARAYSSASRKSMPASSTARKFLR